MPSAGYDTNGTEYTTVEDMWKVELEEKEKDSDKPAWYAKGITYWEGVDASVDGVLGGYGRVSATDAKDSREFIQEVVLSAEAQAEAAAGKRSLVALDCGAGVGRVTEQTLLPHFTEVDLLEPCAHFLDKARENLSEAAAAGGGRKRAQPAALGRAVSFFQEPLEDFTPAEGRYDVIWIQWCVGHLTDADFLAFVERNRRGLKPGGVFVVKENNCAASSKFVVDKEDSSVTRSHAHFCELFEKANLDVANVRVQKNFPKELFTVRAYLLRPRT